MTNTGAPYGSSCSRQYCPCPASDRLFARAAMLDTSSGALHGVLASVRGRTLKHMSISYVFSFTYYNVPNSRIRASQFLLEKLKGESVDSRASALTDETIAYLVFIGTNCDDSPFVHLPSLVLLLSHMRTPQI
ncbi:hypothetical protein BDR06DRAFT_948546 [Suillus hirtellus]|nr:hypothetical protein BDR06DRAFT_948546 [Suillus hirtellus]